MTKKTKCLKMTVAVLSLVLVMCLSVAGTLAYLQVKTEPVVNTFSPSNIGLTLVETTNTYKMVPGVDIAKNPKVTVTADIDCYVFVKVTETDNFDTYMTYAIADGWNVLDATNYPGIYYREVSASVDEDIDSKNDVEAFYVLADNKVTVPNTVTKTEMNALYNEDGTVKADVALPKLTFTAYAIQKDGFADAKAAWPYAQGQQPTNSNP